jgi:hypothetical protein
MDRVPAVIAARKTTSRRSPIIVGLDVSWGTGWTVAANLSRLFRRRRRKRRCPGVRAGRLLIGGAVGRNAAVDRIIAVWDRCIVVRVIIVRRTGDGVIEDGVGLLSSCLFG